METNCLNCNDDVTHRELNGNSCDCIEGYLDDGVNICILKCHETWYYSIINYKRNKF